MNSMALVCMCRVLRRFDRETGETKRLLFRARENLLAITTKAQPKQVPYCSSVLVYSNNDDDY